MMKYIKADELIQFCSSMLVETKDDLIIQTHNNCFRRMREYIKSLPSADVVEVKHGKWEKVPSFLPNYQYFVCSVCMTETLQDESGVVQSNFCPNCGADMRERKETEKVNKSMVETELTFTGATLLSAKEAEEYLTYKERIYDDIWWLCSPCYDYDYVSYVGKDGCIQEFGAEVDYMFKLRPALQIKNLESSNFEIGDILKIGDYEFKIISKDLAWMYKQDIGHDAFNKDCEKGNDYETSYVKEIVDKWYESLNV